jgi:uncharacterized protein (DUF2384 family)
MARRKSLSASALAAVTPHTRPAAPRMSYVVGKCRKAQLLLQLSPELTLLDVHKLIRRGLPAKSFSRLLKTLSATRRDRALEAALGISLRTVQRKRAAPAKPLSPEQSGRVWKFAELLATPAGVDLVETFLTRLEYGAYT